MTEKRFVLVKCVEHYWGIVDKSLENIDQLVLMHMNKTSVSYIVNVLNQLTEENEQLKQAYQTLKSRHSLLHDECLEAECDRDSLKKDVISLEKENEQLKKEIEEHKSVINREWNKYLKKHEMI